MFRTLGLFKNVPCPSGYDCNLPNCIYGHDNIKPPSEPLAGQAYDPFSAGQPEQPPAKRRKVESSDLDHNTNIQPPEPRPVKPSSHQPLQAGSLDTNLKTTGTSISIPVGISQVNKVIKTSQPLSSKRKVSPPPKRESKPILTDIAEKLIPRPVARAPALLKVRLSLIELLYKQMKILNTQFSNGNVKSDLPVLTSLTDQQMIKWILDEEEQAASKLGNDIYRNAMSQKVLHFKKMKIDDWKKLVNDKINASKHVADNTDPVPMEMSHEESTQILRFLRTNLTGLDAHGYVNKAPTSTEIQKAKDANTAAYGYEICDRCGVRFQVFPGRDDEGRLTTKGECHYHWSKLNRIQHQRTDHITGQSQSSYPCCGRLPGSEGCTRASTHVFKVTDPKRMAVLLQFEPTPIKSDGQRRGPVAFDCEMAYTTYGMEVVRVTAVSWPQNEELLDVLVRPYGEILDLNTRFSGVTQEQYTTALPYMANADNSGDSFEEGDVQARPLRKVDSPAAARQLMFDLLTPETPLIGHAIDNDLNTCRMIHPFVVDTVLLYPHPRGLPIRYGLKVLTSKYLSRNIQSGGEAGHDSKEDSVATGDLVKIKVAEKWQMMRLQGWTFQDGNLMPPAR